MTPQQAAESNIAMADAVHDLGQSGRVSDEDLPYCQLALADMMFNTNSPSSKQGQSFTNAEGKAVAFGAWKTADAPDSSNSRQYMYHGLQKISGGKGPIFGDVQGDDVAGQVTSTSGRGEHSTYERYYSSIIYPEIERVSFQYILKSYHDWESAGKPTERPPGWVKYTGFRDRATMANDIDKARQLLAANGIAMDDSDFFVGGERLVTMSKYDKFGSLELFWQIDDYSYQEHDMYQERNQRIMCDFIIKYLYPARKTIDKGVFVFDANAGSIKQLFDSLSQIFSEINPMVLADSAGTCMHQLGVKGHGRNAFCFPFNQPSTQGGSEDRFITQANVHTGLFFVDSARTNFQFIRSTDQTNGQVINYGPTTYNIFTFQIFIGGYTPPNGEWTVNFSKNGPSSGPSVPYLGSVIAEVRKAYYNSNNNPQQMIALFTQANPTPPLGSIMNITQQIISMMTYLFQNFNMTTAQVCLWVERLAMDIKKCGDWEQINSVAASMKTCPAVVGTAMLCTGDYLCSTKARLQGLNGCFHTEQGSGATGWKIELFRNPDISDPNQQQAINIIDKAKAVLPLLILATKNGVNNLRERIGNLRGITAQAVQTYKSLNDQLLPQVAAAVSSFTSLFATTCLAQVCFRADSIFDSMQPLQELRLQSQVSQQVLNAALQAISQFQNYNAGKGGDNQNQGLDAYNQLFEPVLPQWEHLINSFSGTESIIKHILLDLGVNEDLVNQLDTSQSADISPETVNNLIYAGDVEIIVNNGEGIPTLNPAWTCGSAFQYDYTWITAVGLGQDTLLKQYIPKLDVELQKLTNFFLDSSWENTRRAIEQQDVGEMRNLYRSLNAVITQLITANYIFDPKNTKKQKNVGDKTDKTKYLPYIKAAELSTNFYSADLSQLVKQAILVYDFKIPDSFNNWRDIPTNPDQVAKYYNGLKTGVEDFKKLASTAANDLLTKVLPPLYRAIGITMEGGNNVDKNQYGGTVLGGPTTTTAMNNERQNDALKKYFDTLLSTIIGYCRNATYQIDSASQTDAAAFVNALGNSINTNANAFRLARAAFVKGCLLHPQTKMLVFGPQVNQAKLIAFLNEPVFGYLSQTFGIMQGQAPLYDVASLQMPNEQKQIIYSTLLNNTIEELAQTDRLVNMIPLPTDQEVAVLLIFMTAIGTIWSPSFYDSVINAYDNLYVSNVEPRLLKTEDTFADPTDDKRYQEVVNQIPYVKKCVAGQMLLAPKLLGKEVNYTVIASNNFIRSPLRKLMFDNNSLSRFASSGRFSPWTYTGSGVQDDIEAAGASMYPEMTSEIQFKQHVFDSILQASQQLLRAEDIDSARLSLGVANLPRGYYKSANPDITQNILIQMQKNIEIGIVQLTQRENEQERTLNMQRIIQENGQTVVALLTFLSEYKKYYELSNIIAQNEGELKQIYQSGAINTIPISIAPNVFSPDMSSELQQKASAMGMGAMSAQPMGLAMTAGGKRVRKMKKIDWYRQKAKKIEQANLRKKTKRNDKKKGKYVKTRKQQIGCKGKKTTRRKR